MKQHTPVRVILHCAVTPDYEEAHANYDKYGVEQITEWHHRRGFDACGYHWVVKKSGLIQVGRAENWVGAHTKGKNTGTLGICLVGTVHFSKKQIVAIKILYDRIKTIYGIGADEWYCHSEFSNKTCPNIPPEFLREMLSQWP